MLRIIFSHITTYATVNRIQISTPVKTTEKLPMYSIEALGFP